MSVSTLRRFVEAMGGELELTARFPDKTMHIGQFDEADERDKAACRHLEPQPMESPFDSCEQAAATLAALNDWIEISSLLSRQPVPVGIEFTDSAGFDLVCHLEESTIFIECKSAATLSRRVDSSFEEVCARLVSHEIGHYLMRANDVLRGFQSGIGRQPFDPASWDLGLDDAQGGGLRGLKTGIE